MRWAKLPRMPGYVRHLTTSCRARKVDVRGCCVDAWAVVVKRGSTTMPPLSLRPASRGRDTDQISLQIYKSSSLKSSFDPFFCNTYQVPPSPPPSRIKAGPAAASEKAKRGNKPPFSAAVGSSLPPAVRGRWVPKSAVSTHEFHVDVHLQITFWDEGDQPQGRNAHHRSS